MAISTTRLTTTRLRACAVALPLTLLALTACSDAGNPDAAGTTSTSDPAAATAKSPCHEAGDREVTVPGPGGASTFAVGVGKGTRAVLLLHEAQKNHCRWMPFARALAIRGGVQVWAVDSAASSEALSVGENGSVDPSQDLIRMAAYVRTQGATDVVLAGASMGGVGAIVAAGPAKASRIATLSAPTDYNVDAVPSAQKVAVPWLAMAGDKDADFAAAAHTFTKAAAKTKVTEVIVPTGDHGTEMLTDRVSATDGRPVGEVLSAFLLATS